jgi:hypothetical protein
MFQRPIGRRVFRPDATSGFHCGDRIGRLKNKKPWPSLRAFREIFFRSGGRLSKRILTQSTQRRKGGLKSWALIFPLDDLDLPSYAT